MDRWRKKKRKKKKTSLPPSDVTPTIHEVDEEEAQSDTDGQGIAATPTETPDIQPQVKWLSSFFFYFFFIFFCKWFVMLIKDVVHVRFLSSQWASSSSQFSLGSQEDLEEPLPLSTFHTETEHRSAKNAASVQTKAETHNGQIPPFGQNEAEDGEETACSRYRNISQPLEERCFNL